MPTVEEARQAKAERKARDLERAAESARLAEERRVEREKQEALRLERVETWREALESLEARGDLSNLELAGLDAIKLLYPLK